MAFSMYENLNPSSIYSSHLEGVTPQGQILFIFPPFPPLVILRWAYLSGACAYIFILSFS